MHFFCCFICSLLTVIFEMLNFLLFYRLLLVCLLSELDNSSAFPRGETDGTLVFFVCLFVNLELCAEYSSTSLVLNKLSIHKGLDPLCDACNQIQ